MIMASIAMKMAYTLLWLWGISLTVLACLMVLNFILELISYCKDKVKRGCLWKIDEKDFKDIEERLRLADEMVDALHRFDDCFVPCCEACHHQECCSKPSFFAMDLQDKLFAYEKAKDHALTIEGFKKLKAVKRYKHNEKAS